MDDNRKEYKTHLCTFMGREANLKILIPYIDKALQIQAVDNYWFIDMTRNRDDHELIKVLSNDLNKKYPGRVHLYNSEERGKIIDDPDKLAEATKSWETFYKFLTKFTDNDIIAKCDDDTYYIDVETLKAAYEFRWNNKRPYLMHANAINNGVTAYQMKKQGILKEPELDMYPSGGLTGPLFSHPEVACANHKQFTNDMIKDHGNIDKYKLGKNIQFCNRVSINFIFMLGEDRHELSKITYQDEYDTSSKYPQRENRPNVIIGDFTMAHHTYGVQEPVMEELKTHIGYTKLCEKLNNGDIEFVNKPINTTLNPTSVIASSGKALMRAWVENNSYAIRNPETDEFITLEHPVLENKQNGSQFLKTNVARSKNIKDACIFNIEVDKTECIYINNSMMMLKLADKPEMSFPIYKFFQAGYQVHKIQTIKKGDKFLFKNPTCELYLNPKKANENLLKHDPEAYHKINKFIQWESTPFEWDLVPFKEYSNSVVTGKVKRPDNFYRVANDETYAESCTEGLPDNNCPREWIWMVKDYIWEFVSTPKENVYFVKLVADDKPDMYINYHSGENKVITGEACEWELTDGGMRHVETGKWLHIESNGKVSIQDNICKLYIDLKQ